MTDRSRRPSIPGGPPLSSEPKYALHQVAARAEVTAPIGDRLEGLSRDQLVGALTADGVWARRHFTPSCHPMPPCDSRPGHTASSLAVSERLAVGTMALSTGTGITAAEIDAVADRIRQLLSGAPAVRLALAETRSGAIAASWGGSR